MWDLGGMSELCYQNIKAENKVNVLGNCKCHECCTLELCVICGNMRVPGRELKNV